MLEDTFLHESFSTLVWLIIACNNNFKMQKYIYEWIYGIVYLLCKIDKIDIFNPKNIAERKTESILELITLYNELELGEMSILYSIQIRISYETINDNVNILHYFCQLWYNRFIDKNISINKNKIIAIMIYVKELELSDWDVSAIDYVTNSKLIEYISKKYEEIDVEDIKKMILINSSSINCRCKSEIYNLEKWNLIKDYVEKTQKYLLNS